MIPAGTSPRFRTFALVFGIAVAVLYVICDLAALPMFTYHPGTGRLDPGFAPARRDEGPAMYWYGWIATSALGAMIVSALALAVPQSWNRLWSGWTWVIPTAVIIFFVNLLKGYFLR